VNRYIVRMDGSLPSFTIECYKGDIPKAVFDTSCSCPSCFMQVCSPESIGGDGDCVIVGVFLIIFGKDAL
jgi:hypothetical protein